MYKKLKKKLFKFILRYLIYFYTHIFNNIIKFINILLGDNKRLKNKLKLLFYSKLYFLDPSNLIFSMSIHDFVKEAKNHDLYINNKNKNLIFIFPIIDWYFRFQRPQHLTNYLSNNKNNDFKLIYFGLSNNISLPDTLPDSLLNKFFSYFKVNKIKKNLFYINYLNFGHSNVYKSYFNNTQIKYFTSIVRKIAFKSYPGSVTLLIHHPGWYPIVDEIKNSNLNVNLVYDCMDEHSGFDNNSISLSNLDNIVIRNSDLVFCSSNKLFDKCKKLNGKTVLVKNAVDDLTFNPKFFNHNKKSFSVHNNKRKIIGYYGAISDWFDFDLLFLVAKKFLNCDFIIAGEISYHLKYKIKNMPSNVKFIGEIPYPQIPRLLKTFDVSIIPFKINKLTKATNPVKFYEYAMAGTPIVSTKLPELFYYSKFLYLSSKKDFILNISKALSEKYNSIHFKKMQNLALENTWNKRGIVFEGALKKLLARSLVNNIFNITVPKKLPKNIFVSIVIVSFNNNRLLEKCLKSINRYTKLNYEIIIVDNNSNDKTVSYIKKWESESVRHHAIYNNVNYGFSKANNQGLAIAAGDYLVLLNNDTIVTPNWLKNLLNGYVSNKNIGLAGPVTNNIGNEAKINTNYRDNKTLIHFSKKNELINKNKYFEIDNLAFFCVLFSRSVFKKIGGLDESFGLGFFEDDDYCMRVKSKKLRIICIEDSFVHHHLSASFDSLAEKDKVILFNKNKKIYEKKWGKWKPHIYRY